jgi:branched-chain amino acid transport system ATP-binding protein
MLKVENLTVSYGPVAAVRGVSFDCAPGGIVALVGPNGAGKSSLMMAVAGGVTAGVGGRVHVDNTDLLGLSPERRVGVGISLVPERRRIFAGLTVRENLLLASDARRKKATKAGLAAIHDRFPILADKQNQPAGLLSGGQQQQLAIARALLAEPRYLLLDEPSLGLAPLVIDEVFAVMSDLRSEGIGIVLVEQNAHRASELADETLLLVNGAVEKVAGQGEGTALDAYFGLELDVDPTEERTR